MKEELIKFIEENSLSPFVDSKTSLKVNINNIFKTRDAQQIKNKTCSQIAHFFAFPETSNLLNFFPFNPSKDEISKRQNFFKQIKEMGRKDNSFLKQLMTPRPWWKPKYDVVVITEDAETFNQLKEQNIPIQMILSETDVSLLESRDIVQIINCPDYGIALESLEQSVFLKTTEEVYLEKHLEQLSGWKSNLEILNENNLDNNLKTLVSELLPLLSLTSKEQEEVLTKDEAELKIEEINKKISEEVKKLTLTGDSLVSILNKEAIPEEIKRVMHKAIEESGLSLNVVNLELPVSLDYEQLDLLIQKQNHNQYANIAENIKSQATLLKKIPEQLKRLKQELIYFDFVTGISQFIKEEMNFPETSENFYIQNSKNLFLSTPQPISFGLDNSYKCSILTGANSGGKTTLIEHLLQLITLQQLGLPVFGEVFSPIFSEVYYFAKNKGSASKGAFETLLSQMSSINPGSRSLILADEIEAVTEPGVAGHIISATADYFIKLNCFLVIATHLGHEIKNILPEKTRIDGIEAKGLDKNFNLIVDHNPVLGKLAHSTPELIVERMASSERKDYFIHLNNWLKEKKN
jgi:DNA mismatch repair protein MutS2